MTTLRTAAWEARAAHTYMACKGAPPPPAFLLGLFSGELIFGGAYYWREFCVQSGLGLTIKTANSDSPWAYFIGFLRNVKQACRLQCYSLHFILTDRL